MSRNKKTEILIARIFTAVFLFVLISSPISVYAAGESASENESDEEYETWSDAFNDSEYTENLAENIARYWVSTWMNYVGTKEDVIEEVKELIGNQYDNTVDLYENLYQYILPYSRNTVVAIDPSSISISTYGRPIAKKNNLKLIQDYTKTLNNNLQSNGITTFQNIANKKNKNNGLIQFDELPDKYYFATKNPIANLSNWNSAWADPAPGAAIQVEKYVDGGWCVSYATSGNGFDISDCISEQQVYVWWNGTFNGVANYFLKSDGNGSYSRNGVTVHNYSVGHGYDYGYVGMVGTRGGADYEIIYGSCYINRKNDYDPNRYCYYWNQEDLTLTLVNMGYPPGDLNTNGTPVTSPTINNNIIYSVDIGDFTDLVNQLILDVNMDNNITNSLLLELLLELQNQRDNYVENDGDDIYDYIDYMTQKLLEVKDVHIEIPDITPDLGGIAEALTALLNFLASIIRTLGNIVTTLLDGLFHLFIPTDDEWDDIALDFEPLIRPFSWIKGFFVEGTSAISTCLFGYNVLDFDSAETEDVELVSASGSGSTSDGDAVLQIMYNENGAPKIPVHFSNSSSEIFSNIEDAYIIDLSWYTPFKPVGDIIVCAFCWIWFIWRVLHDLPGIISGATGIFDNDTLASVDDDADVFDHDLDKGIAFGKIFGKYQKTSFRNSNAVTRGGKRYQNRKMR